MCPRCNPEEAILREWWNGLLKTKLQHQLGGNILEDCGQVLHKAVYALNQYLLYGAISPIARFPGLGINSLCSAGLKVLGLEGGMLQPGDTAMISLNWKLRLPLGHFGFFMSPNQQSKKRVTVRAGVTDPDYQGETEQSEMKVWILQQG